MGWTIGVLGFGSRRGVEISLFIRTALRPTQPPIQCVTGALSPRVKRPGREPDRSPPSSAEIKECVELYLHSPILLRGVVLSYKTQKQLYFYLYLTFKRQCALFTLFKYLLHQHNKVFF
jgi:hypothetical protein